MHVTLSSYTATLEHGVFSFGSAFGLKKKKYQVVKTFLDLYKHRQLNPNHKNKVIQLLRTDVEQTPLSVFIFGFFCRPPFRPL